MSGMGKERGRAAIPDETTLHLAYAEASIMLIESVMLTLIDRKVIPKEAMLEALEAALATKRAFAVDGPHQEIARVAAGILGRISNSLAASGSRSSAQPP
jgi:hypothetical protein